MIRATSLIVVEMMVAVMMGQVSERKPLGGSAVLTPTDIFVKSNLKLTLRYTNSLSSLFYIEYLVIPIVFFLISAHTMYQLQET